MSASPFILLQLTIVVVVSAHGGYNNGNSNQGYGAGSPADAFRQIHQQRPPQQSFRPVGYSSPGRNGYQDRASATTPGYGQEQTTTPRNNYLLTTTQPNYYLPTTMPSAAPPSYYQNGRTPQGKYGRTETPPSSASRYESRFYPAGQPPQGIEAENNAQYPTASTVGYLPRGEQETTPGQPYEQPIQDRRRYPQSSDRRLPLSIGSYGNRGPGQPAPYNRPSIPASIYSQRRPPYQPESREYGPPIPVTPSPYNAYGYRPQTEASRPGVPTYAPPPPPGVGRIEGIVGPNALNHGGARPYPQVPGPYQSNQGNQGQGPRGVLPYHPEFGYPYFADDSSYYFRVPGNKLRQYIPSELSQQQK